LDNAEKIDRRIRRTKKVMTEALIDILNHKNIETVTVSELAKKADITRTTFYQYYRDPLEMLEVLQNEIAEDLQKIVEKTEGGDARGFFLLLFAYFYEDKTRAEILAFSINNRTGYENIGYYIHNNYMLRWKDILINESLKQHEYYRYYIVFGCVFVLKSWVRDGMKETPEEMADIAVSLLPKEKMYLK
jgi:AcrR family transcriptional regulator